MNVIISQDKSVRLLKTKDSAYNIQEITFYIQNSLELNNIKLLLKKYRNKYPFELQEVVSGAHNYRAFKISFTQSASLTARIYDISIVLNNEEIEIGSFDLQQIRWRY